ncbi:Cytoplasmic polyadenylation element-binding protein 1 [Heterocephalus glaber]|uniref:Cytoplasmic polyadenylation element-binding protein 1 n=1 Tax=Heterocephalus glaber TaxID=10181 RepID=G5AMM9_HETGA|nr:Cytoplasmic polyadenylation element-binding protein 1 [Heterocephalus glaber]
MLHNSLENVLGKPLLSFLPLDLLGSDLDKFPAPSVRGSRLDIQPILDSRSSSPSDSDTSSFSSGSDDLSDLIASLCISLPQPFLSLTGSSPRDPLKMGVGSRMDQEQTAITAVTPSPTSVSKRWPGTSIWPSWGLLEAPKDPFSIERENRLHLQAAAVNEATCTWSGQLLPWNYKNPVYSCKVLLGGVPWDSMEAGLVSTFCVFGSLSVEWPGKDGKHAWCPPKGLDPSRTVFVCALHGMLNAEALAAILNDLFGVVTFAGIDTDKHKYPIGSGRVTFNNRSSYLKAVSAAFVEIKTTKFTKKVQIDPYLEDSLCHICSSQPDPGLLQVLLPELLALAAQHGRPAPPQPPDAEPEEPRFQLEEQAVCPVAGGAQGWAGQAAACTATLPLATRELASRGQGKIIVTFAIAEPVFVSALIHAQ